MAAGRIILGVLAVVMLAGCGGDSDAEKPQGVIPEHQLNALEKAENVENLLEEADKARRSAMDD